MKKMKENLSKSDIYNYMLIAITFVTLVLTGIMFHQKFIKLLPCIISLIIMLLQSRANRYGYLIGGINSLIYAIGFYMLGLFSSMTFAVVFSFPMQVATFIRWSKHPYKHSTVLRRVSNKARIITAVAFLVAWIACYFVLVHFGSSYILFDNTIMLLGIVTTFLVLFAYLEANYISVVCATINLIMFTVISFKEPENITYVIYNVYALIRVVQGLINWRKIYLEQQKETKDLETDRLSINKVNVTVCSK